MNLAPGLRARTVGSYGAELRPGPAGAAPQRRTPGRDGQPRHEPRRPRSLARPTAPRSQAVHGTARSNRRSAPHRPRRIRTSTETSPTAHSRRSPRPSSRPRRLPGSASSSTTPRGSTPPRHVRPGSASRTPGARRAAVPRTPLAASVARPPGRRRPARRSPSWSPDPSAGAGALSRRRRSSAPARYRACPGPHRRRPARGRPPRPRSPDRPGAARTLPSRSRCPAPDALRTPPPSPRTRRDRCGQDRARRTPQRAVDAQIPHLPCARRYRARSERHRRHRHGRVAPPSGRTRGSGPPVRREPARRSPSARLPRPSRGMPWLGVGMGPGTTASLTCRPRDPAE